MPALGGSPAKWPLKEGMAKTGLSDENAGMLLPAAQKQNKLREAQRLKASSQFLRMRVSPLPVTVIMGPSLYFCRVLLSIHKILKHTALY